MNRPVPEGFMTSPPQSVSSPRTAVATARSRASTAQSSPLRPAGIPVHVGREQDVGPEREELRPRPLREPEVPAEEPGDRRPDRARDLLVGRQELEDRGDDAHDGASRDEAGGDEDAARVAGGGELLVLPRADFATRCAMKPPTRSGVLSSSGMYMPSAKASAGTPIICIEIAMSAPDAVEEPRDRLVRHERLDDGGHRVRLRRREDLPGRVVGPRDEAVDLVEEEDDRADGERRDDRPEELRALLDRGRRADPVADLQVGDEPARHRERRADDAADEERREHPRLPREPGLHEEEGREDERHQRHPGDGVRPDRGDRARGDRS